MVDVVVAVGADHEGLASSFGHDSSPPGGFGSVEFLQVTDVVDFHLAYVLAELALTLLQPVDQFPAGGR